MPKTISDIINSEYLETERPELFITENGVIERVLKIVFSGIKDDLKKNFKQKDIISKFEEDHELIEALLEISERLLANIDREYGDLEVVKDNTNNKISKFWHLKPKKRKVGDLK